MDNALLFCLNFGKKNKNQMKIGKYKTIQGKSNSGDGKFFLPARGTMTMRWTGH